MRASARLCALVAGVLALGGCGASEEPSFRVGLITDCHGIFSGIHEPTVASASLPLIERGAKPLGGRPSNGVGPVSVAGRTVELLVGCAEGTSPALSEARRLVEEEGAQVIVGPLTAETGMALREYARRRPETTFIMMPSPAQELTLTEPAPNVFRFVTDAAQSMAGLGSHAYEKLGWRTAVVVADDLPFGWQQAAGLTAEFCASGGRVVERLWIPPGFDAAALVPSIPQDVDGVFLAAGVAPLVSFLEQYSKSHPELSKTLVSTALLFYDPEILQRFAPRLQGTVAGGWFPIEPTARSSAYVAEFARAFPALPPETALNPLAIPYRDGVEAALRALEHVGGDTGDDGEGLRQALTRLTLDSPAGRIRLDENRQAIAPVYLSRVDVTKSDGPRISTLRVLRDVEQTYGGYFEAGDPPPSKTAPACKKGNPPPWARR
jgi:branched-chain amino acid transport system substrate-binding protein